MSIKPSVITERLVAGITLTIAFLVMASVFAPDQSQAGHAPSGHDAAGPDAAYPGASGHDTPGHETSDPLLHGDESPGHDAPLVSTNPHEGLRQLGSLESRGYLVRIYSTELGPRYSVYDQASGRELAVLMTPEKIARHIPDLPLPAMDFSGPTHLMLAEPDAGLGLNH